MSAKGISSSISAALAIKDHIKDWLMGSEEIVSMGVILEEPIYSIPSDLCFSVPVRCHGDYTIEMIKNLELNDFQKKRIQITVDELLNEKEMIMNVEENC